MQHPHTLSSKITVAALLCTVFIVTAGAGVSCSSGTSVVGTMRPEVAGSGGAEHMAGGAPGVSSGGALTAVAGGGASAAGQAVGTLGQSCVTGTYACAGHAQRALLACVGGVWETNGTCPPGQACDTRPGANAGFCEPVLEVCATKLPGASFCQGALRRTCGADLVTASTEACGAGCVDGQCKECEPFSKRCMNNGIQTCNANGTWGAPVLCRDQTCAAGTCVGRCAEGDRICFGNGVAICQPDGDWGAATQCVNQACVGNMGCVGVCTPGTMQCKGNGVQKCDANGTWPAAVECESQACEGNKGCVGICKPNSTQCSDNGVKTCRANGAWGSPVPCAGQACVGGVCAGVCEPGSLGCTGNATKTCDGLGSWGPAVGCVNQMCVAGSGCVGVCEQGATLCGQTCNASGQWAGTACSSGVCQGGTCFAPPSCNGLATNCGPNSGESCCTSPLLFGGTYNHSNNATYPATVSDFLLDKYEVTVGRFRKFVAAYSQNMIAAGAGKNTNNLADVGWDAAWNQSLPANSAALSDQLMSNCNAPTWTPSPEVNETLPINCVNWFEAQAFCIWDGGRLPTEAEWNYAAAGGNEQRKYPWGATEPTNAFAVYNCNFRLDGEICSPARVGSAVAGNGKWGHADLAGNVPEWTLDRKDTASDNYPLPCNNCTNIVAPASPFDRALRGGSYDSPATAITSSVRVGGPWSVGAGLRCARAR